MTATVIQFTQVKRANIKLKRAMGLKPLAKCEPDLPYDEPDITLYVGPARCWLDCVQCIRPIKPGQTCQYDVLNGRAWCADCWPITE